ncbi:MAG: VWA domain-containing protein [Chthoniobacteraceae bacterium]
MVALPPPQDGMMEFAHPWFFVLLLVAPVLWLVTRGSLADITPRQRVVCFLLRAFILLLLVLALAGVWLRLPSGDLSVLFLVDHSASISDAAKKQARDFVTSALHASRSHDETGILGFAKEAMVWQPPATNLKLENQWPDITSRNATEIGNALTFASGVFPPDKAKRIALLSDGNDTGENALDIARKLADAGIELYTVPLRNLQNPEVLIEKLAIPERLKSSEPFEATVIIRSNVATTATVKLYVNGFLNGTKKINVKKGSQDVAFANLKIDEGQSVLCEAEIIPANDTMLENNRAQATATIQGEPLVLIVDSDPAKIQPLVDALRQEKIKVEVRGLKGLPSTLEDLQQFDLFILSDVSALNLTRDQMEMYRMWVQDFGGGFAMLGGENSFGVGGYYHTPVEQMLPVRMEHEDRQDTPIVAMLVELDRSGSMAALVRGQSKISLADQGAVLAMGVLQPKDLFGVTAVDTQVHDVVPLAHPDNKEVSAQKIMSINSSGGGIYIYTSLMDAFRQLRDVNAKIKHVILFSDADDAEEKNAGEMADGTQGSGTSFDLVATMLSEKITTSVVGLGTESDKDVEFLKQLAERGNGRFYLTNDIFTLPQIFTSETVKVAQSSLIEEPFAAVQASRSPLTDGIDWKQSPLLLGYNATKPKPTTDMLLVTERGEPLLATWRYGLGQCVVFTSDAKMRWASEWIAWPGFGKFWAQMVRGIMRKGGQSNMQVTSRESGDKLLLHIDAVSPDGNFLNELPITVSSASSGGVTKTVEAHQDGPGSYAASVDLPATGSSMLAIHYQPSGGGEYLLSHTRDYPKEFLSTNTNENFLQQLAAIGHGKYDPSGADVFARPAKMTDRRFDLTNYFLMLALLLFPVDIWLRRQSWAA